MKRYTMYFDDEGDMAEKEDGEWVRYEDMEKVIKAYGGWRDKCLEQEKRIDELEEFIKGAAKSAGPVYSNPISDLCPNCKNAVRIPGAWCKKCQLEAEHSRHVGENS